MDALEIEMQAGNLKRERREEVHVLCTLNILVLFRCTVNNYDNLL